VLKKPKTEQSTTQGFGETTGGFAENTGGFAKSTGCNRFRLYSVVHGCIEITK
jgi:hypothetical protein